jgi:hypothetical protein
VVTLSTICGLITHCGTGVLVAWAGGSWVLPVGGCGGVSGVLVGVLWLGGFCVSPGGTVGGVFVAVGVGV